MLRVSYGSGEICCFNEDIARRCNQACNQADASRVLDEDRRYDPSPEPEGVRGIDRLRERAEVLAVGGLLMKPGFCLRLAP
jgi:hypothetical protein